MIVGYDYIHVSRNYVRKMNNMCRKHLIMCSITARTMKHGTNSRAGDEQTKQCGYSKVISEVMLIKI